MSAALGLSHFGPTSSRASVVYNRMPDLASELATAREACLAAGAIIRDYYRRDDLAPRLKADQSPLTDADLAANRAILDLIQSRFPDDGILSEETTDDLTRLSCERVWIVDPLDGTRDFVRRTGDFAVLVGLAIAGTPSLGVVYAPAAGTLYHAVRDGGAFVVDSGVESRLSTSLTADIGKFRIGVTRFNVNPDLQRFIDNSGLSANITRIGASIKMMALARGEIDLTVCLNADEKEWDTCAPEVIIREAGGMVSDTSGAQFVYNKPDVRHLRGILMSNNTAHADLVERVRPYFTS
jgi:3'(2'),5'-bisphosphate nucleotidase